MSRVNALEGWPPWVASPSALCAALAIDAVFGELPARVHPVVWIGRAVRGLERRLPTGGWRRELLGGALLALLIPAGATAMVWLVALLLRLSDWVRNQPRLVVDDE